MKITALETMAHKPGLYRVSVDNKPLGYISAEDIFALGLVANREIDTKLYSDLVTKIKLASFYSMALAYTDRRLRSKAEVETYLKQRGCDQQLYSEIIAKLTKLGIIDEQKLARAFIHDTQLLKPLSKKAVAQKLKQKRIKAEVIEEAIRSGELDDLKALDALIAQKAHLSAYANNQPRLFRYLLNKGFSYTDIADRIGKPELKPRPRAR